MQTNFVFQDAEYKELTPPKFLPNSEGFRFIGVSKNGISHRCEVVKSNSGAYRIEGMKLSDMIGWYN